jgi:hypothetical protein
VEKPAPPAAPEIRWLIELEKAKKLATDEGKDLFINFTGLSWCGACTELERDVLTKPEFASIANDFVLVRLDYPGDGSRLPEEPAEATKSWRETYGINLFPTVILADASGKPYAVTGNNGLKPGPYADHIRKLQGGHARRDATFAKAGAANGIEKAKFLAEGLSALRESMDPVKRSANSNPLLLFYADEIDQVVRLDADGTAGLRDQLTAERRREQERVETSAFEELVSKTYKDQGIEAVLAILDARMAAADSVALRNRLRQLRQAYLESSNRYEEALAMARELAADESLTSDERYLSRTRIAFNLRRLDRIEEAIALLDKMIAEAADDPRRQFRLHRDKAGYLWYKNRFAEALAAWDKAATLVDPNTQDWRTAQWERTQTLARLGRERDAWAAYEGMLSNGALQPLEQVGLSGTIAWALNEAGALEAAIDAAGKTEKAMESVQIESKQDREYADQVRQFLAKMKATATSKTDKAEFAAEPGKVAQ